MNFEAKKPKKITEKIGYVVMYFIFTTIFYFILKSLDKLPDSWNYFHVLSLTLSIVLLGTLIKLLLK